MLEKVMKNWCQNHIKNDKTWTNNSKLLNQVDEHAYFQNHWFSIGFTVFFEGEQVQKLTTMIENECENMIKQVIRKPLEKYQNTKLN